MTPRSLFNRVVVRNPVLHQRYKNPEILPIDARPILDAVFQLVSSSPVPGVYQPDPDIDGADPLPAQVARTMDAVGAEETIGDRLARLVRLGFIGITTTNAITVNLQRAAASPGPAARRTEASRSNGIQGGRPRAGETAEQARERRSMQGSLMLPLDGGVGPVAYGSPLAGAELAQQLRSQIRLAPFALEETSETQETRQVADLGFVSETQTGSSEVPLPEVAHPVVVVVEQNQNESQPLPPPLTPSIASANAPAAAKPETETRNPNPGPQPPKTQTGGVPGLPPITPVSAEARELAAAAAKMWNWPETEQRTAPRVFQNYLDAGWTAGEIAGALPDAPARTAQVYEKVLQKKHGTPGRHRAPTPPVDTRHYPAHASHPEMGRLLERLRRGVGEADYKSWLADMRVTAIDGEELELWLPLGFKRDYVRKNLEMQLERVAKAVIPGIKRLRFVSPNPTARAG